MDNTKGAEKDAASYRSVKTGRILGQIIFVAMRDIDSKEELTIDIYPTEDRSYG